jgi:hypothetical protein
MLLCPVGYGEVSVSENNVAFEEEYTAILTASHLSSSQRHEWLAAIFLDRDVAHNRQSTERALHMLCMSVPPTPDFAEMTCSESGSRTCHGSTELHAYLTTDRCCQSPMSVESCIDTISPVSL